MKYSCSILLLFIVVAVVTSIDVVPKYNIDPQSSVEMQQRAKKLGEDMAAKADELKAKLKQMFDNMKNVNPDVGGIPPMKTGDGAHSTSSYSHVSESHVTTDDVDESFKFTVLETKPTESGDIKIDKVHEYATCDHDHSTCTSGQKSTCAGDGSHDKCTHENHPETCTHDHNHEHDHDGDHHHHDHDHHHHDHHDHDHHHHGHDFNDPPKEINPYDPSDPLFNKVECGVSELLVPTFNCAGVASDLGITMSDACGPVSVSSGRVNVTSYFTGGCPKPCYDGQYLSSSKQWWDDDDMKAYMRRVLDCGPADVFPECDPNVIHREPNVPFKYMGIGVKHDSGEGLVEGTWNEIYTTIKRKPFDYNSLKSVESSRTIPFMYPYLMYVPRCLPPPSSKRPLHILVMPADSGLNEDHDESLPVHQMHAYLNLQIGRILANELDVVVITPIFPRNIKPHGDYDDTLDTHSYGYDAITTSRPGWQRLDLQLIGMIDDAVAYLEREFGDASEGIVSRRVLMYGIGSAGKFASRFAALHPEFLSGLVSSTPSITTPPSNLQYDQRYPIGVSDINDVAGTEFNQKAFKDLPMLYYIGSHHHDDDYAMENVGNNKQLSRAARDKIKALFGSGEPDKKYHQMQDIFEQYGCRHAHFKVYDNDEFTPSQRYDVINFMRECMIRSRTKHV